MAQYVFLSDEFGWLCMISNCEKLLFKSLDIYVPKILDWIPFPPSFNLANWPSILYHANIFLPPYSQNCTDKTKHGRCGDYAFNIYQPAQIKVCRDMISISKSWRFQFPYPLHAKFFQRRLRRKILVFQLFLIFWSLMLSPPNELWRRGNLWNFLCGKKLSESGSSPLNS